MSIQEMRAGLLALKDRYPRDFLLIRSEHDVDKINLMNSDISDLLNFGDPKIMKTVTAALEAGKQVAVQGAGQDRVLIHVSKPGKKLLR